MTLRWTLLAGLTCFLAACSAEDPPTPSGPADPASTALEADTAFSASGLERLDRSLARVVSNGEVPNLSYVLIHQGEVVQQGFHGTRTLGGTDPVDENTLYRIYSMTKPVTGVAMMMLYEDGLWSPDDPVTDFIPEFADLQVLQRDGSLAPAGRPPTVGELLNHTAGFTYGNRGDAANVAYVEANILGSGSLDEIAGKLASIPLLFEPGDGWSYSVATDIQGLVIERLSGQSLSDFMESRIFTPLGMNSTGFYAAEEDRNRLSDIVGPGPDGPVVNTSSAMLYEQGRVPLESAGQGLVSTLADYQRFVQMLANGGELNGVRLLSPESVEMMVNDTVTDAARNAQNRDYRLRSGRGYGVNIGVVTDGRRLDWGPPTGTWYWHGASGTWFWHDPENGITFIGMVQSLPPPATDVMRGSMDQVYRAFED